MKQNSTDPNSVTRSVIRRIRVKSSDSAFIYAVFEASEGVCAYSTIPHRPGDLYRDLELIVPVGQLPEFEGIIADLTEQLAGELYVIPNDSE